MLFVKRGPVIISVHLTHHVEHEPEFDVRLDFPVFTCNLVGNPIDLGADLLFLLHMLISGVYQDVKDGGRAMRSCLEQGLFDTYYWVFNINVDGDAVSAASAYKSQISGSTVTTLEELSDQFIGETISQMDTLGLLLTVVAKFMARSQSIPLTRPTLS